MGKPKITETDLTLTDKKVFFRIHSNEVLDNKIYKPAHVHARLNNSGREIEIWLEGKNVGEIKNKSDCKFFSDDEINKVLKSFEKYQEKLFKKWYKEKFRLSKKAHLSLTKSEEDLKEFLKKEKAKNQAQDLSSSSDSDNDRTGPSTHLNLATITASNSEENLEQLAVQPAPGRFNWRPLAQVAVATGGIAWAVAGRAIGAPTAQVEVEPLFQGLEQLFRGNFWQ